MKNKISSLLFFLIAGILFLAGCNTQEVDVKKENGKSDQKPTSAENTKTDEPTESESGDVKTINFEGISFHIPETAEELDMGDQGVPMEIYMLDSTLGTSFNVLVETLPEAMSLDEYVKLATANTGYEYLNNENYKSNGIEWNEAVSLNHTDQGTIKLNQRTLMIENKAYVFTYGSITDNYDNSFEDFKKITESVSFEQQ